MAKFIVYGALVICGMMLFASSCKTKQQHYYDEATYYYDMSSRYYQNAIDEMTMANAVSSQDSTKAYIHAKKSDSLKVFADKYRDSAGYYTDLYHKEDLK